MSKYEVSGETIYRGKQRIGMMFSSESAEFYGPIPGSEIQAGELPDHEEAKQLTARAVACLNAMDGRNPEALPAMLEIFREMLEIHDRERTEPHTFTRSLKEGMRHYGYGERIRAALRAFQGVSS